MIASEILLIYNHPLSDNAPTIMEHVNSFEKYSKYKIRSINTELGFPKGLDKIKFPVIVLHYSVYHWWPIVDKETYRSMPSLFWEYLQKSNEALKIAFFQDEMDNCQKRFILINKLEIDIVFSLLKSCYFDEVYKNNTNVNKVFATLTGYVCESLIKKSQILYKPFHKREIDVGYRARPVPFYLGKGGQEKTMIGDDFQRFAKDAKLSVNISSTERDRIYGDDWLLFVSNCKFMLGVESGTSIFDINGDVAKRVAKYLASNPSATFLQVSDEVLEPFEGNINYRTISPRIFECAALRVCMVFFKGDYQNIIKSDVHYIGLEKDYSNIEDVLIKMKDEIYVNNIIENAFRDLIQSGNYHYSRFIAEFDSLLEANLIQPIRNFKVEEDVTNIINKDLVIRKLIARIRHKPFPGRNIIKKLAYAIGYKEGNL
jgi:hypothetical protein